MTEFRRTVAFEIYIMRQARWELHARYGPRERTEAVNDAKAMNGSAGIQAVKVTREVFNTLEEITEEYVVYKSRRELPAPVELTRSARRGKRRPLRTRDPNHAFAPGHVIDPKVAIRVRMTMAARALFTTFVGLAAAGLVTAFFSGLFSGFGRLGSDGMSGMEMAGLIAIFFGVFLAASVIAAGEIFPLVEKYCKTLSAGGVALGKRRTRVKPKRRPPQASAPSSAATGARQAQAAPPAAPPAAAPAAPAAIRDQSLPSDPTPATEEHRAFLKAYLNEAMTPVRGAYDIRDQFIRFGINLFTAGTCDTLCKERNLGSDAMLEIMADVIRSLGVPPLKAKSFAANHLEYLVADPRYAVMFESGQEAIRAHLGGRPQATDLLCRALDIWAKAEKGQGQPSSKAVTVMFTEITNYEETVARQGDVAGQQVLHIHNAIVDAVLREFGGKQIKQLQNGAMISFGDCAQAVEAAVAIRDRLADHTRNTPAIPVSVKIGLNLGEPISEDNDLFGSTVQLAARIAGHAEPGQVLVSKPVHEEAKAKSATVNFAPRGTASLKGFTEPVPVFSVMAAAVGGQVPAAALESF